MQGAAQALIDGLTTTRRTARAGGHADHGAGGLRHAAGVQRAVLRPGDIPPLESDLDVDLFNTFRAALFPAHYPIPLTRARDDRGRLVETVRAHGGQGQTFVSTTKPGITRGEHFHLRKVERFVVVGGAARISPAAGVHRRGRVVRRVSGDEPVVIDMPTMWAHNITNTGDDELTTLFWTNELFDPRPDTYPEPVER